MSNKYTWDIEQLDCVPSIDGQSNVVSCVHWRVKSADGVNTAQTYGTQTLDFDSNKAFTAYPELDKQTVIGWVQGAIGAEQVASIYASLDNQLETLANPPVVSLPLPWANNA